MRPPPEPPPLRVRAYALISGAVCHLAFAAAVAAMIGVMLSGMTAAFGRLPAPVSYVANAALLAQFAVAHSLLLTRRGRGLLARAAPGGLGASMASTTYVTIAALQVLALFLLWTPSGLVWWRATGPLADVIVAAHAAAWLFLLKAIADAGLALQTGALGWRAVFAGRRPEYPPLPTRGVFAAMRQPIYLAFALTTWTTPVWTPDQLAVALTLTAYCALGPILKEWRTHALHGEAFARYQAATPFWSPLPFRAGLKSPRRSPG